MRRFPRVSMIGLSLTVGLLAAPAALSAQRYYPRDFDRIRESALERADRARERSLELRERQREQALERADRDRVRRAESSARIAEQARERAAARSDRAFTARLDADQRRWDREAAARERALVVRERIRVPRPPSYRIRW